MYVIPHGQQSHTEALGGFVRGFFCPKGLLSGVVIVREFVSEGLMTVFPATWRLATAHIRVVLAIHVRIKNCCFVGCLID